MSRRFELHVVLDNAAFDGCEACGMDNIFEDVMLQMEEKAVRGSSGRRLNTGTHRLRDINGNWVGYWEVKEDEPDRVD